MQPYSTTDLARQKKKTKYQYNQIYPTKIDLTTIQKNKEKKKQQLQRV